MYHWRIQVDVETPAGRQNVVESSKKKRNEGETEKESQDQGKQEAPTTAEKDSMDTDVEVIKVNEGHF